MWNDVLVVDPAVADAIFDTVHSLLRLRLHLPDQLNGSPGIGIPALS